MSNLPDRPTPLYLRQLGLTQTTLAHIYGVNRPTISAALQPVTLYPPLSVLRTWRGPGRSAEEIRGLCEKLQAGRIT